MSDDLIYASRLVHLPVLGPDETFMGRIGDVVLTTNLSGEAPTVNGFVVEVPPQRRVFVSAGRIAELDADGARVRRPNLNMRTFELRPGEFLAVGELIGRKAQGKIVIDIGLVSTPGVPSAWQVSTVALGSLTLFRRPRMEEVVEWEEVSEIFTSRRPLHRRAVQMNALHPAEMAAAIRQLPTDRRRALAAILEDERLADLLEELPEEEQVKLIEGLDVDRIGSILDEMEADDAADLLGELPAGRRDEILEAMTPDEADPVRRLLSYDPNTAGGLMTPEPVIMAATATVAEALAAVRNPDLPPALGAQVYVTAPPFETPTGRYLGVVGYQRLLREPPFRPLARCLDEHPDPIAVAAPEREVAARVAFYDVVAVPVTDEAGRLVGAVTIDDVLDAILPEDWREQRIDGRP
jgi:CBS domain-containing protein